MATKARKSTKKGATKKGAKKTGTKSRARKGSSKAGTSDFLGSIISVFGGRTKQRMSEQTRAQLARGNGISVSVTGDTTSFDSLVKELGRRLIIDPDRIRPRGCSPCHSGLDFILIGPDRVINPVLEQLQAQFR